MNVLATRMAFAAAAAVTAAALVDPLVEKLSNAGVFGAGRFTDGSNADVIPALAIAALLCAVFIALTVQRVLRDSPVTRWVSRSVSHLDAPSVSRLLPVIFALQLGILYVMETLEQVFAVGHSFGGTIWLGAPILASLLLHFTGSVIVSFVLSRALHAIARRVVDAVHFILCLVLRCEIGCVCAVRREPIEISPLLESLIACLKERAPPHPAV